MKSKEDIEQYIEMMETQVVGIANYETPDPYDKGWYHALCWVLNRWPGEDADGEYFIRNDPRGIVDEGRSYQSIEAAIKEAQEILEELSIAATDEGWPSENDMKAFGIFYFTGEKLYGLYQVDRQYPPDDLDDEGYSPSQDIYWNNPDWDYICGYELRKIECTNGKAKTGKVTLGNHRWLQE